MAGVITDELAAALADADRVVVLTGAGVSAASGIPTFRDALTGLWAKYDPARLATPEAFDADAALVTRWYDHRRMAALQCQPNPAHTALVQLERIVVERGGTFTLITQNVDRLHQRAGSLDVVELHGSLLEWRCTQTGNTLSFNQATPFDAYPPMSPAGYPMRPGVVWFGEMLPEAAITRAQQAAASCDVLLTIGTSGVVYPAAGLTDTAIDRRAVTAEFNLEPTPMTARVSHAVIGPCDETLPAIARSPEPEGRG